MKKLLCIFVVGASVVASPVSAGDVTPSFTDEEAQVLVNLIDIAVKTQGLAAAGAGSYLAGKINAARAEAKKAAAEAPQPKKPD